MDEGFEVLTLVQTGKTMPRPIVMVENKRGAYWKAWLRFVKNNILKKGMIDASDLNLFQVVSSPEEARDVILHFYRNYHSIRYVGDRLVIRIQKMVGRTDLLRLNQKFSDIIFKGKIEPSGPLAAEAGDLTVANLPRLVFYFNRRKFGRLRELIDAINLMGD